MEERLVIADDDQDLRELLAEVLTLEGYQVATAANGLEALAQVTAHRPDLVISDVRMPICDGYELARRLSLLSPPVRLLLISGYAGSDDLQALLQEPERVRFLPKPLNAEKLLAAVRRFLTGNGQGAPG